MPAWWCQGHPGYGMVLRANELVAAIWSAATHRRFENGVMTPHSKVASKGIVAYAMKY
jgi:hypothetical protein